MHSTSYVIKFIIILTGISALLLSLLATSLRPAHEKNEAIFNKRAILAAVEGPLGREVSALSDDEVLQIFSEQVDQTVTDLEGNEVSREAVVGQGYPGGNAENIDMAKERKKPEASRIRPIFIYEKDGEKYYIISVRGSGLWDEIWGNIALESDFNTIAGAAFDHKGETPGLGAEIKDNPGFAAQFIGKKIYDEQGNFTSVKVMKGPVKDPAHQVDGISGATITINGVSEMLYRGIQYYEPYFEQLKGSE